MIHIMWLLLFWKDDMVKIGSTKKPFLANQGERKD